MLDLKSPNEEVGSVFSTINKLNISLLHSVSNSPEEAHQMIAADCSTSFKTEEKPIQEWMAEFRSIFFRPNHHYKNFLIL